LNEGFWRRDTGDAFDGVTDEALAELVVKKHPNAFSELLNRYTKLMLHKISCTHPAVSEMEDYMQECSLALLRAAQSYSGDGKASFRTYAGICIENRLRSIQRSTNSDKNRSLVGYVELTDYLSDIGDETSDEADPEAMMIIRESVREQQLLLRERLSQLEYRVFSGYVAGMSYQEIAGTLGLSEKAVNNAMQRIRRKLKEIQQ